MSDRESQMMRCEDGDGFLLVQFKWEAVKNEFASKAQGQPIYDQVLRVYITTPGRS